VPAAAGSISPAPSPRAEIAQRAQIAQLGRAALGRGQDVIDLEPAGGIDRGADAAGRAAEIVAREHLEAQMQGRRPLLAGLNGGRRRRRVALGIGELAAIGELREPGQRQVPAPETPQVSIGAYDRGRLAHFPRRGLAAVELPNRPQVFEAIRVGMAPRAAAETQARRPHGVRP
jgi:hypothetical protein